MPGYLITLVFVYTIIFEGRFCIVNGNAKYQTKPFLAPKGAYEVQMLSLCGSVGGSVCPHYALQLF